MTQELTRPIDDLYRLHLPKELRKALDWDALDTISFTQEGNTVILNLYEKNSIPKCDVCQKPEREIRVNQKDICAECLDKAVAQIM